MFKIDFKVKYLNYLLIVVMFFLPLKILAVEYSVGVSYDFGFIMSSSDVDNGGVASNPTFIAGINLKSWSFELILKYLVFKNEFLEQTGPVEFQGLYKTEMTDILIGLIAKYKKERYIDFSLGYVTHFLEAEYLLEDVGPRESLIDGQYWGVVWGIALKIPFLSTWEGFIAVNSYVVNDPISFFNIETGVKYYFK